MHPNIHGHSLTPLAYPIYNHSVERKGLEELGDERERGWYWRRERVGGKKMGELEERGGMGGEEGDLEERGGLGDGRRKRMVNTVYCIECMCNEVLQPCPHPRSMTRM